MGVGAGDVFKEQLVTRKPSRMDMTKKTGIVVLAVLVCLAAFLIYPPVFVFVVIAAGIGVFYLFPLFNVEYEYIFTNGDLDIDVIYAKNRRKRVFSGDVKDISVMTHISEKGYEGEFRNVVRKDCTSGVHGESTYQFAGTYNGKKLQIIFEPNEMMITAMTPYLGHRLIKKR